MDVSDIAYDAFLINGREQLFLPAKPRDRVRLRLINAGAATYFFVHSAFPEMTIVAADGNEVRPHKTNRLLMGMGETYDIIVTMADAGSCEIRATAQDVSGHASLMLGSGAARMAGDIVRPNYYSMDHMVGLFPDLQSPTRPKPALSAATNSVRWALPSAKFTTDRRSSSAANPVRKIPCESRKIHCINETLKQRGRSKGRGYRACLQDRGFDG